MKPKLFTENEIREYLKFQAKTEFKKGGFSKATLMLNSALKLLDEERKPAVQENEGKIIDG